MKLDPEDKEKIKLLCEIFNAQALYIDGVRIAMPERGENGKRD